LLLPYYCYYNTIILYNTHVGDGYKQISKGIPCGHYDGSRPHPIILHDPQGGPKAKYMSKENDPNYKQKATSEKKGEQEETPSPAPTLSES